MGDVGSVERAAERLIGEFSGEAAFLALNLATGAEIGVRPDVVMPTASTIKLLVLAELYRQVGEGTISLDDAVTVATALKHHGCDLIHAVMGQNVAESRPDYGRMFGVPAADRIRNEAEIPTLAAGNIPTSDEVNTILAAGRADLCLLDWLDSTPQ